MAGIGGRSAGRLGQHQRKTSGDLAHDCASARASGKRRPGGSVDRLLAHPSHGRRAGVRRAVVVGEGVFVVEILDAVARAGMVLLDAGAPALGGLACSALGRPANHRELGRALMHDGPIHPAVLRPEELDAGPGSRQDVEA